MLSHSLPQTSPQSVPQPAGLFVPQALLLYVRLKPTERNAWMVFRSLADSEGRAAVSYESPQSALLCAPGSHKAALATVSRTVLSLRLSAWIDQTGYRRDPRTGFSLAGSYIVRNEALSFTGACLGNADYLPLLERGLEHTHVIVRQLARDILDQAMSHPDELACLPSALQEQVKRLHQQAHSPEDGSGGSASRSDESGQYISLTSPTFPKSTPETPETVRTYSKNKVYKEVPTYSAPQTEMAKLDAITRFKRLAADQQHRLSDRLQVLPEEQRRDVLAEWSIRCAAGTVRDAAAYLFGLIRKALEGTFRLWAARKNKEQERPTAKIQETPQEAPRETPKPPSTSAPIAEPADNPASREVASAHLQRIKALLQGTAGTAPAIQAMNPPKPKHPQASIVHALAQGMSPTSQPRPLAAFLTPIMATGR
jgi:hypothetical protein